MRSEPIPEKPDTQARVEFWTEMGMVRQITLTNYKKVTVNGKTVWEEGTTQEAEDTKL